MYLTNKTDILTTGLVITTPAFPIKYTSKFHATPVTLKQRIDNGENNEKTLLITEPKKRPTLVWRLGQLKTSDLESSSDWID